MSEEKSYPVCGYRACLTTWRRNQRLDKENAALRAENERLKAQLAAAEKRAEELQGLSILRMDGDPDGKGMPTSLVLAKGELAERYIPEASFREMESREAVLVGGLEDYRGQINQHGKHTAANVLSTLPAHSVKVTAVLEAARSESKTHGAGNCNCLHGCRCVCQCDLCQAVRAVDE